MSITATVAGQLLHAIDDRAATSTARVNGTPVGGAGR
jgi:hypothetical protein